MLKKSTTLEKVGKKLIPILSKKIYRVFTKVESSAIKSNNNQIRKDSVRFFSNRSQDFKPHSLKHLKAQQKLCEQNNIPYTITKLPEGTQLIAPNISKQKPYSLNTGQAYLPNIVNKLSETEKNEWHELAKEYGAQMGSYKTICKIYCLKTRSKNGKDVYHIDLGRVAEADQFKPLNRMFELDILKSDVPSTWLVKNEESAAKCVGLEK